MEKFERTAGKRREKYLRKEVPELREPIEIILEQLRDKIDAGTYFLIIGDDASGRVPALVFDRFLKAVYKEKGYPTPQTMFVAGSGSGPEHVEDNEAENKYGLVQDLVRDIDVPGIEDSLVSAGKRVLVVTEAIVSGRSLTPLMEALTKEWIPFDVAVLGIRESDADDLREEVQKKYGAEIISGSKNIYPKIMHRGDVSGTTKNKGELFSVPTKSTLSGVSLYFGGRQKLQKTVNDTRHDVDLLAQKLLEWYKVTEKDKEKAA
jgi:hypothetical protein